MLRVISEVRPRWVVAENVRGLLSVDNGDIFEEVAAHLEGEGYEVWPLVIPASAVDAPHRRDRIWVIAFNADGFGERAGHREIQNSNGEVSKRNDNAESGNADLCITHALEDAGRDSNASDGDKQRLQRATTREATRLRTGYQRCNRNAANTDIRRLQRYERESIKERAASRGGASSRPSWREHWLDVASRTCVRGVDDGLSDELDVVGSRDNRASRLKALGNAIVPEIAFQIFKAIEQAGEENYRR